MSLMNMISFQRRSKRRRLCLRWNSFLKGLIGGKVKWVEDEHDGEKNVCSLQITSADICRKGWDSGDGWGTVVVVLVDSGGWWTLVGGGGGQWWVVRVVVVDGDGGGGQLVVVLNDGV
ncbi:hypothetical protein QVD17_29797 [Tagetes erecta]|uniref:Uncharacterized protein n=1 Tax=Tagetes erecta TaxID=13708 RepID=A0AAD8K1M1_TARER|nr:hypothetical protein QVD17_29797 [Tagetes erecta]